MTALAANVNILERDSPLDLRRYKVADNVLCYKGGIAVIDTAGYVRPARNTATDQVVGIFAEAFDNTISGHAAGGRDVLGQASALVSSGAHYKLLCSATASQASVGQTFYALDDATVRLAVGNGNVAGKVTEYVDATHVWVYIPICGGVSNAAAGALGALKTVGGQLSTASATDTVVTGLALVVSCVASYDDSPGDANDFVSATFGDQAGTPAAGSIIVKTWKSADGADVTPVAATSFTKKVNWIAVGY